MKCWAGIRTGGTPCHFEAHPVIEEFFGECDAVFVRVGIIAKANRVVGDTAVPAVRFPASAIAALDSEVSIRGFTLIENSP